VVSGGGADLPPLAAANLVNIVWVCPGLPGMSADVKIWDKYGPQRTKGVSWSLKWVNMMRHVREDIDCPAKDL
jgi:hypothetical protein